MSRNTVGSRPTKLEYWQMNIPFPPAACPEYLQNLSAKNIQILQTADVDFTPLSWDEVKHAIANDQLNVFWRLPSEQRRYLEFCWAKKMKWGSMAVFVLEERLHWPHIDKGPTKTQNDTLAATRFNSYSDVVVKKNDWPYGIDKRIAHLIVWTAFPLLEDETTGRLTESGREEVGNYVDKVFRTRVPKVDLLWFRNWHELRSVEVVDHFHVLLYDPDPEFIAEITGGDIAISEKEVNTM